MPTYQIRQTRMRPPLIVAADVFFDDFPGSSVDTSKWMVLDRISDQVNGEVNCVIPANASVASSVFSGVSKFEDHSCGDSIQSPVTEHYTSWQLAQATAPFTYGTIDCRMKLPGGTGIWPTLFITGYLYQQYAALTANPPQQDWPNTGWGEIDIAEFWQNSRTTVNNSAHVGSADSLHLSNLGFDASTQFAVYRLVWTSTSLTWQVNAEDGNGFVTTRTIDSSSGRVPTYAMFININAAIGGTGGGTPDSATFPQTFQIDYVRVTQP